MDESLTPRTVQHRGRGGVFDSVVDAIGDTPIVPSFAERYLSTALFEGI